jgi:hypothetical protein
MVDRFWDFLLLTGKMFDWNSFGLAEKRRETTAAEVQLVFVHN